MPEYHVPELTSEETNAIKRLIGRTVVVSHPVRVLSAGTKAIAVEIEDWSGVPSVIYLDARRTIRHTPRTANQRDTDDVAEWVEGLLARDADGLQEGGD